MTANMRLERNRIYISQQFAKLEELYCYSQIRREGPRFSERCRRVEVILSGILCIVEMAVRREIRLELHEHRLPCPYCDTTIQFFSPMPVLSLDDRICPKCGKAFFIDGGFAKRITKKPAQKAITHKVGAVK